ncbi:toxin-antitoxin system YwqK family antitoxin [Luteibaculum oceani]|uniref:Toxin-antitoxin system YwqK family antitoxin n=1 Tax=Luteibaculum oceani TaxID=1294296 RepID=A0A5C6VID8_9FLAO|nr:hypothetical protein [Luteibaculum oceani]TXC85113.1 hypothetical protein FRX97_00385 [Luteibaculum oceani]
MRRKFIFSLLIIGCLACNQTSTSEETQKQTEQTSKNLEKKEIITYYETGELESIGFEQNGQRIGTWSSWYKTGEKKTEVDFIEGKKHGLYRIWHKNGKVQLMGEYDMDIPVGTWTSYDTNGIQISQKVHTQD